MFALGFLITGYLLVLKTVYGDKSVA